MYRMKTVEFKFAPRDYVVITIFEINYFGRIISCTFKDLNMYDVAYAEEGILKSNTFYEDELCAV